MNNFEYIPNNQLIDKINIRQEENAFEVSNLYPNNLVKHNLRSEQRELISYLRSQADIICRNELLYEYIKYAFNKFKQGFTYYQDKRPVAFCIWRIYDYVKINTVEVIKRLHILLICGKQLDYKLVPRILDDVIYFCRKSNIQYITLEPANDKLKSYYINCGFKERFDFSKIPILELDVKSARFKGNPNTKLRFKTQKKIRYKPNNKSHKN